MQKIILIQKLAFLLVLSTLQVSHAKEVTYQYSDEPPAGFEDLAAPQHTRVDIYFADKRMGEVFATFSPNSFEFDQPEVIAQVIPGLTDEGLGKVSQALTGQLDRNVQLICLEPHVPQGCGLLEPDAAGIIFNEGHFRVDLFINKDLLETVPLLSSRYLPLPDKEVGLSGLLNLSGIFSGATQQDLNYNIETSGILSHRLARIRMLANFTDANSFQVQNLVAEKDWQNWQGSIGMFFNTPMRLTLQKEVLGFRFATSYNLRTDLDQAYGSELSIFLPRRALVKVFRDDRLLVSKIFEAGNQIIDTRNFPNGIYDVRIVIDDPVSGSKEEIQFFSKTSEIPPLGSPFYYAEAGLMRTNQRDSILPNYSSKPLVQAGTARRFTDTFGADASIITSGDETIASMGLIAMYEPLNAQFRFGGTISLDGEYGVQTTGTGQFANLTGNFGIQHILGKTDKNRDFFSLMPNPFTQANISVNYFITGVGLGLDGTQIGLRANWRQNYTNIGTNSTYSISPNLRIPIYRKRGWAVNFNIQYTITENDSLALAGLSFQTSGVSNWTYNGNLEGQYSQQQQSRYSASLLANWEDRELFPFDLRSSVLLRNQQDSTVLSAEGEYNGSYGGLTSFVDYTQSNQGNNVLAYGGQFNVSMLAEKDSVAVGGYYAENSGVILELQGTPKGAYFDILVSQTGKRTISDYGRAYGAAVGKSTAFPLRPYESYSIRIVARKNTYAEYDTSARQITLYPGTIQRLVWDIKQVFILIGQIVRPDGSIVADAQIDGSLGPATTGPQGFFQAEVETQGVLKVTVETGEPCIINVPENLQPENGIVFFDQLECSSEN